MKVYKLYIVGQSVIDHSEDSRFPTGVPIKIIGVNNQTHEVNLSYPREGLCRTVPMEWLIRNTTII